ncbi:MAG: hypothetical protein ACRD3Q_11505 [Terriglobales bacterium]
MTGLFQDLRYAFRQLRKSPGFTAVAVITLALGIGVNVASFSVVDELWLHSMPVKDPDRIVRIFNSNPSSHGDIEHGYSSYPDFQDLRAGSKTLAGVAALDVCSDLRMGPWHWPDRCLAEHAPAADSVVRHWCDRCRNLILSTLLLGMAAVLASYIHARRAARVDPMVALSYE